MTNCLSAQPGTLDPSFNISGTVTTTFVSGQDAGRSIAIQPDGKIIVAGSTYTSGTFYTYDFAICRYETDGTLDQSFGSNGKVTTDFYGYDEEAKCLAIQDDGKILVAGYSYDFPNASIDFAMVRYLTNGNIDSSFGLNGKVLTFFDGDAMANSIVIQTDGKIILAGMSRYLLGDQDFGMVRYKSDGSIDSTFGLYGITRTDFTSGSEDNAYAMALQSDGKIVLAGETRLSPSPDFNFAIVRYETDGDPDASFGNSGKVIANFGQNKDEIFAVAIQEDQKIIVTGKTGSDFSNDFGMIRYNTNGTPDPSFGFSGRVNSPGKGTMRSILIQPDSNIVVAGELNSNFTLYRYHFNGTIDSTFGTFGQVLTSITGSDVGHSIALQDDGKLVLAGTGNNTFAVARYYSGINTSVVDQVNSNAEPVIFPNPAVNSLFFEYHLSQNSPVDLELFDADGKLVQSILHNETRTAGIHREQFTFQRGTRGGNYFLILKTGTGIVTRKILKF